MMIAFFLSLAAAQSPSIDDQWALVNSCRSLAAFRSRWGERNRYSAHYAQVSRRYGCSSGERGGSANVPPASTRGQKRREPPRPVPAPAPRPRPAPAGPLATVILDASGRGDARTLYEAYHRTTSGGVIVIRPGTYSGGLAIRKNITLRGVLDSAGNAPSIVSAGEQRPPVHVYSGTVSLENLNLQGSGPHVQALYAVGGTVSASNVRFAWSGSRIADHEAGSHAAVYIGGTALATFQRSVIGPGETQALAIGGRATVTASDSLISNPGGSYSVFVAAGALTLRETNVKHARIALTTSENARVTVIGTVMQSTGSSTTTPLMLFGTSELRISQSVVCVANGSRWVTTHDSARIGAANVFNAAGVSLVAAATRTDIGRDAQRLCSTR